MYNFSGIYYEMKSSCGFFLICGILLLLMSKFWVKSKKNIKEIVGGLVCVLLAIASMVYYMHIIKNPQVRTHEGYFVQENRAHRHLLMMEYSFTNEDGLKPVFNLDVLSKKEIYPDDFDKNIKYRIYYEEETYMIIKVEKIV